MSHRQQSFWSKYIFPQITRLLPNNICILDYSFTVGRVAGHGDPLANGF